MKLKLYGYGCCIPCVDLRKSFDSASIEYEYISLETAVKTKDDPDFVYVPFLWDGTRQIGKMEQIQMVESAGGTWYDTLKERRIKSALNKS